jgi:hypothetical protein
MQQWIVPVVVAALGLATASLTVAIVGVRRRARAEVDAARGETELLRERVAGIEARLAPRAEQQAATEYVITDLGHPEPADPAGPDHLPAVAGRIDGRLFADLVLRETVVKGASLAHGVRRALEPENRFRMRYTFRREVKSARKRRRLELREARRMVARRRSHEDVA